MVGWTSASQGLRSIFMYGVIMWINGQRVDNAEYITFGKNNDGRFGLSIGNVGLGAEIDTVADVDSTAESIVALLGYPWIMVGSEESIGTSTGTATGGILAYNLEVIPSVPQDSNP